MEGATEKDSYRSPLTPAEVGHEVNEILHKYPEAHLTPAIPYGNMWASCYFAMTGFHALHVLGGIVAFAIILLMGVLGKLGGSKHVAMLEYTGLYWHFVDIVWIFLFPLIYLV
jgi:cytochrome c oxidase subunit 3